MAGGVGLCELIQHMSFVDYIAVSGNLENRVLEYVDHLHDHFVDPVRTKNGYYLTPQKPGFSVEMKADSIRNHTFPDRECMGELSQRRVGADNLVLWMPFSIVCPSRSYTVGA